MFKLRYVAETDSTNRLVKEMRGTDDVLLWTDFQTAGRGCGNNTWESERAQNLLFSALYHPQGVSASRQFVLSMAEALAVKAALDDYADGIRLKWPNDIYWHDRKLGGTLIETTLNGGLVRDCIFGTGLNVNQQLFRSDAPNPVSLCHIVGHMVEREPLLQAIAAQLERHLRMVDEGRWDAIGTAYRASLYRRGEVHQYRLPSGEVITMRLDDVDDDGRLVLTPADGHATACQRYGFKEITFII